LEHVDEGIQKPGEREKEQEGGQNLKRRQNAAGGTRLETFGPRGDPSLEEGFLTSPGRPYSLVFFYPTSKKTFTLS